MKRVVAMALGSALFGGSAYAEEFDEGGQLYAIQNRKHVISHEFAIGIGTVPLDAFYKGLTGSFSYTYHFDDLWGWEIVQAAYSFNLDTSLREDLENNFGVQPTDFPELTVFGSTNVVIKPLYGKLAYLNETLIYGELFLIAGPALAEYKNAGVHVGLNLGFGLRVFLSEYFAVRIDIRDYEFINATDFKDLSNELFLQVGIGLNIH